MNVDNDVETLADVLFEALALSSSIRRQAGSGSELGRLMQQLHDAIEANAKEVAEYQLSADQLRWCVTCGHRAVDVSNDEPFCHACHFNFDRNAERV